MSLNQPFRPSVQATIDQTESFFKLATADRNNGEFIVNKLCGGQKATDEQREHFLQTATALLIQLHCATKFEQSSTSQPEAYDSSLLLALYKLLDFLALEGLYPSIPEQIGLVSSLRAKSLFYARDDPVYVAVTGKDQLDTVLHSAFDPILAEIGNGVEPLIRHRTLSHLFVAYAVSAHQHGHVNFDPGFAQYLARLPTATLLASCTTLLQTSKSKWFRTMVSEQLVLATLRDDGVRCTIDFLAASHSSHYTSRNNNPSTEQSTGPSISMEALQQASRLLSSVPRNMTQHAYFAKIAPQLLELLDDQKQPALRSSAAFIVSNGILSKRSIGAPGSAGWIYFVTPIMEALQPTALSTGHKRKQGEIDGAPATKGRISTNLALMRLIALVLLHPNSSLTGRLIKPLLLPLWALANASVTSFTQTENAKSAYTLLSQFLRLVGNADNLIFLADSLLHDEPPLAQLAASRHADIENITSRTPTSHVEAQVEEGFKAIHRRVETFCRLFSASSINDETLSTTFQHLFHAQITNRPANAPGLHGHQALLKSFANLKLLQSFIETFANRLTRDPQHVVDLTSQVLDRIQQSRYAESYPTTVQPTLSSLATIIKPAEKSPDSFAEAGRQDDVLLLSLSLLNAFAVSSEAIDDLKTSERVDVILSQLEKVKRLFAQDERLAGQIQTTIALLDSRSSRSREFHTDISNASNAALDVQRTLALITADIASDLPPVRRSALYALQALIKSADSPMDVPTLALLLLDVIRQDAEEFVYLAAIQTMAQLAYDRNFGYVTRLLVEAFADEEERSGLDGRLRIGEALSTIAESSSDQNAADAKVSDVVRYAVQDLLNVASRRGRRERETLARQREERLERRKRREAERAWGGEVPDVLPPSTDSLQELSSKDHQLQLGELEAIEAIVKGWEDTGFEEDVRIRASALTIVASFFEKHVTSFQSSTIMNRAIEICLPILSLELDSAKAILRRAAALALLGILKGIDAQIEDKTSKTREQPVLQGDDWLRAEQILRWVVDTDPDELTVGHSEIVLEGLEAVRMKLIAGAMQQTFEPSILEADFKGLNVDIKAEVDRAKGTAAHGPTMIEEID